MLEAPTRGAIETGETVSRARQGMSFPKVDPHKSDPNVLASYVSKLAQRLSKEIGESRKLKSDSFAQRENANILEFAPVVPSTQSTICIDVLTVDGLMTRPEMERVVASPDVLILASEEVAPNATARWFRFFRVNEFGAYERIEAFNLITEKWAGSERAPQTSNKPSTIDLLESDSFTRTYKRRGASVVDPGDARPKFRGTTPAVAESAAFEPLPPTVKAEGPELTPVERFKNSAQRLEGEFGLPAGVLWALASAFANGEPDVTRALFRLPLATFERLQIKYKISGTLQSADSETYAAAVYLAELCARFHGALPMALGAFLLGPSAVQTFGRVPPLQPVASLVARVIAQCGTDSLKGDGLKLPASTHQQPVDGRCCLPALMLVDSLEGPDAEHFAQLQDKLFEERAVLVSDGYQMRKVSAGATFLRNGLAHEDPAPAAPRAPTVDMPTTESKPSSVMSSQLEGQRMFKVRG